MSLYYGSIPWPKTFEEFKRQRETMVPMNTEQMEAIKAIVSNFVRTSIYLYPGELEYLTWLAKKPTDEQ